MTNIINDNGGNEIKRILLLLALLNLELELVDRIVLLQLTFFKEGYERKTHDDKKCVQSDIINVKSEVGMYFTMNHIT